MAEVITFVNFKPPPRYDSLAFTSLLVEESADKLEPWTEIDTILLSPVDTDPAHPQLRSCTTEQGTALGYWYRITFRDATGDESPPTTPIQNLAGSTTYRTAYATVDELARVLELRNPSTAQTDALQRCLDAATYEVDSYVGHDDQYPAPYPSLAVEVTLERAVEHWSQSFTPYGVFQASGVPILTARDTFIRHGHKLLPLKETFGVA